MKDYILGFKTLKDEISCDALPIRGNIPRWLTGTLVRNGPGQFEAGSQSLNHWFDGFAMLHAFSFKDGSVSYKNAFLQSKAYQEVKESKKMRYSEFATDPCRSFFKKVVQGFFPKITDNACVNVSRIANRFVALTELPVPIEFDKELKTIGEFVYEDSIKPTTGTAHPHYDFERREVLGYFSKFGRKNYYCIYRIKDGSRKREIIASIPVAEPGFIHSFSITKNYIVFIEFPFKLDPRKMILSGKPYLENLKWKQEDGARFFIINRNTGEVVEKVADSFFSFHHINAFEKENDIILDISAFPDASIVTSLYLKSLMNNDNDYLTKGQLRRYHIQREKKKVSYEVYMEGVIELPRINYKAVNTKEYGFVYGVGTHKQNDFLNQLLKVEMKDKTVIPWYEEHCYPGEPVFVPVPNAKKEDDGVILSVVLSTEMKKSFLLVLDACSFTELGRAEVPHHIPFGFHGQYFT